MDDRLLIDRLREVFLEQAGRVDTRTVLAKMEREHADHRRQPLKVAATLGSVLVALAAIAWLGTLGGGTGPGATPTSSESVAVPNVIGMTQEEATTTAEAVLLKPLVVDPVVDGSGLAVLRQTPPAGWRVPFGATLRVSVRSATSYGGATMEAQTAKAAIAKAAQALARAGATEFEVVSMAPAAELDKDHPCLAACALVHVNSDGRGATVPVDLADAAETIVAWQTAPFEPENLMSEVDLVDAAAQDPDLTAALRGRPYKATILGAGAAAPLRAPCIAPTGEDVCMTVAVYLESGGRPALIAVNFLTSETRLDQAPGD